MNEIGEILDYFVLTLFYRKRIPRISGYESIDEPLIWSVLIFFFLMKDTTVNLFFFGTSSQSG